MSQLIQKSEIHFSVISPSEKREQEAIKEAERKAELARAEAKRKAAQKAAEARKKAKEAAELAAKNKVQSIKRKKTIYTLLGVGVIIVILLLCIKFWYFVYEGDSDIGFFLGAFMLIIIPFIGSVVWLLFKEVIDEIK